MKKKLFNEFSEYAVYELIHEEKQYPEYSNLILKLKNKDGKTLSIMFENALRFDFDSIGKIFIENIYEIESNEFLEKFLSVYFISIPIEHGFKNFSALSVDDGCFLKVVAQKCYSI